MAVIDGGLHTSKVEESMKVDRLDTSLTDSEN